MGFLSVHLPSEYQQRKERVDIKGERKIKMRNESERKEGVERAGRGNRIKEMRKTGGKEKTGKKERRKRREERDKREQREK